MPRPLAATRPPAAPSPEGGEESGTFAVPPELRQRAALPLSASHLAAAAGHAKETAHPAASAKAPTQLTLGTEHAAHPCSRVLSPVDRAIAVGLDLTLDRLQRSEDAAKWSNRAIAARAGVDKGKVADWRHTDDPAPAQVRVLLAMGREEGMRCLGAMFDARAAGAGKGNGR